MLNRIFRGHETVFLKLLGLLSVWVMALVLSLDFKTALPKYLPIDDCYIVLAYARNVIEHGDFFSYNHGLTTTGITSPLYCLVLAFLHLFSGDWLVDIAIVGFFSFVFILALGSYLAWLIGGRGLAGYFAALTFSLFWGCWGYMGGYFAYCGMEPILAIVFLLASVLAFVKSWHWATGMLIGLSALCRPEAVFLGFLFGLVPCVRAVRALIRRNAVEVKKQFLTGCRLVIGFVALYGLWMIRCLQVSGSIFPATVSVKTISITWPMIKESLIGYLYMYNPNIFDVRFTAQAIGKSSWVSLRESIPVSLLVLGAVVSLRRRLMFLVPLAFVGLHFLIAGLKQPTTGENMRYLVFDYTLIVLYISVFVGGLLARVSTISFSRKGLVGLGCFLSGLILFLSWGGLVLNDYHRNLEHYRFMSRYFYSLDYKIGEWLRDNTPKDTVVALYQAGAIKYFGNREIVDYVGLTDHTIWPYIKGPKNFAQALVDRNVDYVASFGEEWLASLGLDMRDTRFFTRVPLQCRGLYKVKKAELAEYVKARYPESR